MTVTASAPHSAMPSATQFRLSAMGQAPAVFLQPTGGAALACGGAAALVAQAGWASTIVTVFAPALPGGLEPDPWDPVASRAAHRATLQAAEEVCAAAVLGCSLRSMDLPDAARRGEDLPWLDQSEPGASSDLARMIALEVMHLPCWRTGTQVFVPVAARLTPDHAPLFEAGRTLAACGVRVWAYEDFASEQLVPGSTELWVASAGEALGEPLLLSIDTVLARKLDAAACLRSEQPGGADSPLALRAALTRHAWRLGGEPGRACERYWPVRG